MKKKITLNVTYGQILFFSIMLSVIYSIMLAFVFVELSSSLFTIFETFTTTLAVFPICFIICWSLIILFFTKFKNNNKPVKTTKKTTKKK